MFYEIEISERKVFLNAVAKAVTEGVIEDCYDPAGKQVESIKNSVRKYLKRNDIDKLDVQDKLRIMELLEGEVGEYDISALGKRTLVKKLPERENIVEGKIDNLNKKRKIISRIFRVRRN